MTTSSTLYPNGHRTENMDPEQNSTELIAVTSFDNKKESNTIPISNRPHKHPRILAIKKMLSSCCSCTSSK